MKDKRTESCKSDPEHGGIYNKAQNSRSTLYDSATTTSSSPPLCYCGRIQLKSGFSQGRILPELYQHQSHHAAAPNIHRRPYACSFFLTEMWQCSINTTSAIRTCSPRLDYWYCQALQNPDYACRQKERCGERAWLSNATNQEGCVWSLCTILSRIL